MKYASTLTTAVLFAASACQAPPAPLLDAALVRDAGTVELALDANGSVAEVEYHVDHEAVPIAVRTAFHRLRPGITPTGAEHEFEGGAEYWELIAAVGRMKVEILFRPDGTVVSEEIEVTTNTVPAPVRAAVDARFAGAGHGQWEMIRDGGGNVLAYHVKFEHGGKRHKVAVAPSGEIRSVRYEIAAEIEVPAGS